MATLPTPLRSALLLAVLAASSAGADDALPPDLDDAEVERRLAFLEERLDAHRTHARLWQWGWTGVNGGAALTLAALGALADSNDERVNLFGQSALAFVGLVDLYWLRRMPARDGFDPMRALPAATPAERRARLARAEAMLRGAAARPSGRAHWFPHVASVVVNGAVGLGTWAAGDAEGGLVSALSGIVVGEVYLWSEPFGWREDLAAYEAFAAGRAQTRAPRWSLVAAPGGLALRWEF